MADGAFCHQVGHDGEGRRWTTAVMSRAIRWLAWIPAATHLSVILSNARDHIAVDASSGTSYVSSDPSAVGMTEMGNYFRRFAGLMVGSSLSVAVAVTGWGWSCYDATPLSGQRLRAAVNRCAFRCQLTWLIHRAAVEGLEYDLHRARWSLALVRRSCSTQLLG